MSFERFLQTFIPKAAEKRRRLCEALWQLETTGTPEAAQLAAELRVEEELLYEDSQTYRKLIAWSDPRRLRELEVLRRAFKFQQVPKELIEEIAHKEQHLSQSYASFRPEFEGKAVSENDILALLKEENDPKRRQRAWEASKEIGGHLAPQILELVPLRNKMARALGYDDFFQMMLDRQEVDEKWLFATFEEVLSQSEKAYQAAIDQIEEQQTIRFGVELGPWAWSDPFGQNDPLDDGTLDELVRDIEIVAATQAFFQHMGLDVAAVLQRSDLYERLGKNPHAFCINMDRGRDVRILANVKPNLNWLDGLLHELGHAVYELGIDPKLSWLLRSPPSPIATEAIALLFNRQAYRYSSLCHFSKNKSLMKKAEASFKRRQFILSRFVMVLTYFERELYRHPEQDLNALWWRLVHQYQKIPLPKNRVGKCDWAAKLHIGLCPVYSYSYFLGEMLASALEESRIKETGEEKFCSMKTGAWLREKVFHPGSSLDWRALVHSITGRPLNADAWLREFC